VRSQGRIEYANGDVFEGTFENDHIVGHGVLKCADGSSYVGQWAQSQVRRTPHVRARHRTFRFAYVRPSQSVT